MTAAPASASTNVLTTTTTEPAATIAGPIAQAAVPLTGMDEQPGTPDPNGGTGSPANREGPAAAAGPASEHAVKRAKLEAQGLSAEEIEEIMMDSEAEYKEDKVDMLVDEDE
jgi:hypothetical protein